MAEIGLILFAHGARDARWAAPFEALLARLRERRPELPAALAFLEHMSPDLQTAALGLAAQGVRRIRVVPCFSAAADICATISRRSLRPCVRPIPRSTSRSHRQQEKLRR